jgi:hypothetical protein
MPVAQRGAGLGALIPARRRSRRWPRPHQLLENPLQAGADPVGHLPGLERGEQFGQVMTGESHRRVCFYVIRARSTPKISAVTHASGGPRPIDTTSRDVSELQQTFTSSLLVVEQAESVRFGHHLGSRVREHHVPVVGRAVRLV